MADDTVQQPAGALDAAFLAKAPQSKTGLTPTGALPISATQTNELLANMQQMINQRAGVNPDELMFSGGPRYNTIMNSLKDAAAWASGGVKGPTEGLALRDAEKAKEAKDLFEMRTQMATYKSAQEQAKAKAEMLKNFMSGAGATGTGGYVDLSPEAKARFDLAGTADEKLAIINEDLKTRGQERTKKMFDPASLDRKDVLVFNPDTNKDELRQLNMFEYQDLKSKGFIRNPSEMFEKTAAAPKVTATAPQGDDVLPKLQKAVFRTESSSGKADTAKPGIQGAIGPMQITPDTFDTAKRLKLIPADYDINNTTHNKEAGNNLLAYYYNKYDRDPDKTLAAYHGGEGAINKDGSINYDRKDKLGTSIGAYIDLNKARAGLANDLATRTPGVQVASTGKTGIPDIASIKAQQKAAEEEQLAASKKRGESAEAMRTSFENDTDPGTLSDNYATSRRIQTLVKNDPTITGVLTGPGYAKAVGGILEKGIGNFGIADLDDAIFKTLPTTTNMSAADRKELSTYLAKIELQAAKLIKGQGQITEGEREILQRSSSSIKDPAELIYKKARVLERVTKMNEELAAVYGDGEKFTNFRKFKNDPEFKRIHAEFRGDLENILNEKVEFARPKTGAPQAVKEGAESTSKSGKPIIFRNGRWEYK